MTRTASVRLVFVLAGAALLAGCPAAQQDHQQDTEAPDHATIFTADKPYNGTSSCLECHDEHAQEFMQTYHWNWQGPSNIVGHEDHIHGKTDLINNFCIAIASNEGRCSECHAGYGWKDGTFDFTDATKIDCLVCHDNSGQYGKEQTNAGMPKPTADLQAAARSVGSPTRANCGACHFYAGGGDNVKHGDLASTLVAPTRAQDVHMGGGFTCQQCHKTADHRIAGAYLHSVETEGHTACTDCHNPAGLHEDEIIDSHLDRIACQTCHIPTFSRSMPTVTEWYWKEAGQNINPIPTDEYGKQTYDKKKGRFVWSKDVVPTYMWYNGKTRRYMLDSNDSTAAQPVTIAAPDGSIADAGAKIYPFKKMVGNQPGDAVNKVLLVPHLFGTAAGPNPYWGKFNWSAALAEGTAAAGQAYSGSYEWVDTVMYLTINHEIAPKEQALTCFDCHISVHRRMDFKALGYSGNPWVSAADGL